MEESGGEAARAGIAGRRSALSRWRHLALPVRRNRGEEIGAKLEKSGMRLRPAVLNGPPRLLFDARELEPPTARGMVGDIRNTLDRLGAALDRLERSVA
jgi:hypothetical protein